ncbi:E3 ubiquitin-protein ligase TTC3 isoform X2 [Kryptolebias marmoratus]|uniref:RING-type E3 ubiquitin transferase n=1 Tax=Kryptolebias marmoratus TaxID=37003 RepID=A0A3Q3BKY5_KRYMA|nr:E3 ubiquitin-protein ligase TTC3 isoform X2 [Kryptolebias marmoratus]
MFCSKLVFEDLNKMSDSDSDGEWENSRYQKYKRGEAFAKFYLSDETYSQWNSIPVKTRRDAAQRMKVCVFWLPTVLQPDDSKTFDWALEIGFIGSRDSEELQLEHMFKIQIVESILFDLEMGTLKKEAPRHVFYLANLLNLQFCPESLEKAVHFLEKTGDRCIRSNLTLLGDFPTCLSTISFIFSEYAKFIQEMSTNLGKTLVALMAKPDECYIAQSERMKAIGNDQFRLQRYEEAVKYYSKAIKFFPDNHILYGNRALCYIRSEKYLKAAADGKRAVLIQPLWAKGHYRYCEALFNMHQTNLALEANNTAILLCQDNLEGLVDLVQQRQKMEEELTKMPKPAQSFKAGPSQRRPQATKNASRSDRAKSTAPKVTETKMDKKTVKTENSVQSEGRSRDSTPSKSEKRELGTPTKKKPKNRDVQESQKTAARSKADVCMELRSLVQDAHAALYDLRSRNAEQAFSQALSLLETVTPKELGLSTVDVLLLLFGRVSALTEIGQPEELAESQKLLDKMKSYESRTFQSLVFFAIGRVFLRENRFAVALQQFSDSLQMVKNQITPGKLTWPLTKEIVKETQPEYFKEILDRSIELCKFPPPPDAVCRLEKCLCPLKAEIFLTDPDFKGFVEIRCCHSCRVEFHVSCWKSLKTTKFFERNEKDFLHEKCLTPDCIGRICSIKIFCPTGLVKCKFEAAIAKPQTPKKPKVNQKCTSLKKLKSKEEHKLKKKQYKQSFQDIKTINDEILQKKDDSGTQKQQKAWLVYRDPVLLQINQNSALLREEKGLLVSALAGSLKPWLELDSSRGNQIAARLLNWQQEPLLALGQAVELLLERKNRVWARVFIQQLSSCVDINPKLSSWASQLNNAGLNAARTFIDRHAEHLEQQDLTLLLHFEPLKEMILEKLSAIPEFFSSTGLTVTEYLKQAPTQDMRLFIWTLEEYQDDYVSCHAILDEYFDMMDGHGSVLKKSDENENNSMKAKSRGRKKKQREPKGLIVFPGMRGGTRELDQDVFEEDSLSFLHPGNPFSVPPHLREQVAEFEEQYGNSRSRSPFINILDNNPDPTKESLYDYFAQILEEHGPLVVEDPLLVGELQHFPAAARQKMEEAGGFEAFLLESLRFIKMGRCIGLAKHAVALQQAGHAASLDDLDEITDTDCNASPDLYTASVFPSYLKNYTEIPPVFPNPYLCDASPHWTDRNFDQASNLLPNSYGETHLDALDTNFSFSEPDLTSEKAVFMPKDETFLQRHAAAQTCPKAVSSVAVNTELYEPFESYQGDLNKKEKGNINLEQMIKKIKNCVKVNDREDIVLLEKDIKTVTINIQETLREQATLQQKLEEEVEKDQKEKKANQEELKALKTETEQLVEEQTRLSQNIREKKSSYEKKLRDSLELRNQSAAEKMSLEDEIKRCKTLLASSARRSHKAQLSVVESSRDQGLYGLYRELTDAKALLSKLDEAVHRNPNQDLEGIVKTCRAKVEEMEKKISSAERRFQEELDQLSGEFVPQASGDSAPPAAEAPLKQQKPVSRKPEAPLGAVRDKVMESLTAMFPDYKRPDLMKYIQEFCLSRGGSLSSVALQDVVGGVTQRILDHQERLNSFRASIVEWSGPGPYVAQSPVWQAVTAHRFQTSKALNVEDPCIICHEDMSPDETCVLECRHGFHEECIRSWLKEQSTCPTCRTHALMPDDFPALLGRRRQAP